MRGRKTCFTEYFRTFEQKCLFSAQTHKALRKRLDRIAADYSDVKIRCHFAWYFARSQAQIMRIFPTQLYCIAIPGGLKVKVIIRDCGDRLVYRYSFKMFLYCYYCQSFYVATRRTLKKIQLSSKHLYRQYLLNDIRNDFEWTMKRYSFTFVGRFGRAIIE